MSLATDLLALTKPRVISLLLVTAVAPMFITDRGLPPLSLIGWVLLAGFLMAGGANAINMWFHRDIDVHMARTKLRPVPAGRLAPGVALLFAFRRWVGADIERARAASLPINARERAA